MHRNDKFYLHYPYDKKVAKQAREVSKCKGIICCIIFTVKHSVALKNESIFFFCTANALFVRFETITVQPFQK